MNLDELVDGFKKGDILKVISNTDMRINKTIHIKDITSVKFVISSFNAWTKPEHYSVSYTWEGESSVKGLGYIKDGRGDCAVQDLKMQLREIKINDILK